jgi:hypothetical protein
MPPPGIEPGPPALQTGARTTYARAAAAAVLLCLSGRTRTSSLAGAEPCAPPARATPREVKEAHPGVEPGPCGVADRRRHPGRARRRGRQERETPPAPPEAPREGVEPPTRRLTTVRSACLSYRGVPPEGVEPSPSAQEADARPMSHGGSCRRRAPPPGIRGGARLLLHTSPVRERRCSRAQRATGSRGADRGLPGGTAPRGQRPLSFWRARPRSGAARAKKRGWRVPPASRGCCNRGRGAAVLQAEERRPEPQEARSTGCIRAGKALAVGACLHGVRSFRQGRTRARRQS